MPFQVERFSHHGITVRSIDCALEFFEGVLEFTSGPPIEFDEGFGRVDTLVNVAVSDYSPRRSSLRTTSHCPKGRK